MGIFTGTGYSGGSFLDMYSPAEKELCCEGFDINYYETAMIAIAESEEVYNKSFKEIGIAELRYFEENGQEIVYEAVDVKAVFNKIKMFFKKLLDKVKAIFHTFIAKMQSVMSGDNKAFAHKYKNEFSRKWGDVKEEFEFKGYKFTIKDDTTDAASSRTAKTLSAEIKPTGSKKYTKVDRTSGTADTFAGISAEIKNDISHTFAAKMPTDASKNTTDDQKKLDMKASYESIRALIADIKDNKDDIIDNIRFAVFKDIATTTVSGYTHSVSSGIDAKEFSEELFKVYRNGESSKESIEKKDLSPSYIVSTLEGFDKLKSVANKYSTHVSKNIDLAIKGLEDDEKAFSKKVPSTAEPKDEKSEWYNAAINYCTELASLSRIEKECYVQGLGAFLQALKDRVAQYKAIMVKVISGSKKMQRESYDYTNESYDGSGSFLDSVVLK